MVTLFDIMRNAQSGQGFDNLSRQFGLTPADTQRAVEALLPAFTLGFQRNVYNPTAFGQFVELLSSGQDAPFFDGAKPAAQAAAWASGNWVLTQILGSKDVTRKVAEQAASMTGIGAQVLQQMLPMVAATLMGGIFRYASLQGMGDLFAQWSDAFHKAHTAQQRGEQPQPRRGASPQAASANPFEAWAAMMGSMFSGENGRAARERRPEAASRPAPANPIELWSAMVESMLGKPNEAPAAQGPRPSPAPRAAKAEPQPAPKPQVDNPLQALSQMFETGREVQAQHLATLQSILDGFWGARRAR
jgi:hypothetical protein